MPAEPTTPTKDGFYPGVSFPEYRGWKALSQSFLKQAYKNCDKAVWAWDQPEEPKEAFIEGRAHHAATFESDRFLADYAFSPPGIDRRTKAGKERWAQLQDLATKEGRELIKEELGERALLISKAVNRHPVAAPLLSNGEAELSFICTTADGSSRLKGRADWITPSNIIVDLKTTRTADPDKFSRDIFSYGYDVQADFYESCCYRLGRKIKAFYIIAVEKEPPFSVCCFEITEETRKKARHKWLEGLTNYMEGREERLYKGYNKNKLVKV